MPGRRGLPLFGMAYQPNVSDVRESPAINVADLLERRGAVVRYSGPFVPAVRECWSPCLPCIGLLWPESRRRAVVIQRLSLAADDVRGSVFYGHQSWSAAANLMHPLIWAGIRSRRRPKVAPTAPGTRHIRLVAPVQGSRRRL